VTHPPHGRSAAPAASRYLTPADPHWPPLWRVLDDAPAGVYASGDTAALARPCLGIVGTRRATARGLALAHDLAAQLAAAGWVIVSGLARGIDAAAHRGALAVGGSTIAVMATGPDLCYPPAHRGLLAQLRARGCAVTEFAPGTPPLKHHFLQRNRLLAGLVRGVVVVEAPRESGALHTARLALEAGREVFAVPGPVDLESSRGCHRLLREGAALVESAADVLAELGAPGPLPGAGGTGPDAPGQAAGPPLPDHAGAQWLHRRLDLEGCRRDDLRRHWPGDEGGFVEALTVLELAGLIQRLPGGRLARRLWPG
jgi:DNA processing protein